MAETRMDTSFQGGNFESLAFLKRIPENVKSKINKKKIYKNIGI